MKGYILTAKVESVKIAEGEPTSGGGVTQALAILGLYCANHGLIDDRDISEDDWIAVDFVGEDGKLIMRMRQAY